MPTTRKKNLSNRRIMAVCPVLRAGTGPTRTLPQIMRQGRWKDQRTAMMYIRPATVWQDNPTEGLSDDEPEKKR